MLSMTMPLFRVPSSSAPKSAPTMEPLPPDRLAPPRMTAEMTSNSMPLALEGMAEPSWEQ